MQRIAIYPGTFDPITFGHIDIIKKSLKIVDKLIVATTDTSEKDYLFSVDERMDILKKKIADVYTAPFNSQYHFIEDNGQKA